MSYDVGFYIDTGAKNPVEIWECNITYNICGMLAKAGISLRDFHEVAATEIPAKFRAAANKMEDDPATYDALAPENGWGDRLGTIRFLRSVANAAAEHPKTTFEVH